MEVGHKGHLQIAGFDCRNFSVESSGLCSAHDAWSKINKVSAIVNNDSGCRAGTIRIGNRRAGPEEHYSGSGEISRVNCFTAAMLVLSDILA